MLSLLLVTADPGAVERFATERGSIYTFTPSCTLPASAPVVLYVHGYWDRVEEAFVEHRLADQFRASGRCAVFIVPAAPSSPREKVLWPELEELLARIELESGRRLSRSAIAIAGHSGAYRTLRSWSLHPGVDELILLDAMYGDTSWLERLFR